jgi:hypothetical protein
LKPKSIGNSLSIQQVNDEFAAIFPNQIVNGSAVSAFYPKSEKDKLREQLGID